MSKFACRAVISLATVLSLLTAMAGPAIAKDETGALRILVVGDSISVGCGSVPQAGWCGEFSTLLTQRGVGHVIVGHVRAGWSCVALRDEFEAAFNAAAPDLVIMNCGTNDAPQSPNDLMLGWAWRWMVEYAYTHGAMILPTFIQYSNPEINQKEGRGWLVPAEANANDTIFTNRQYYVNAPRFFAGLADLQQVPGDWGYLNGGKDGIHPNAVGNRVYAALFYRSLRAHYGWPDTVPQPCGMWGHRAAYDAPEFTFC